MNKIEYLNYFDNVKNNNNENNLDTPFNKLSFSNRVTELNNDPTSFI